MQTTRWCLGLALLLTAGCNKGDDSGGDGSDPEVNGCKLSAAEDHKGEAAVTIAVGDGGDVFSPDCLVVDVGTAVTFEGTFADHPLRGGEAEGPVEDPDSPIPATDDGTEVTVTFDEAGSYGFYCDFHFPAMGGAVHVTE